MKNFSTINFTYTRKHEVLDQSTFIFYTDAEFVRFLQVINNHLRDPEKNKQFKIISMIPDVQMAFNHFIFEYLVQLENKKDLEMIRNFFELQFHEIAGKPYLEDELEYQVVSFKAEYTIRDVMEDLKKHTDIQREFVQKNPNNVGSFFRFEHQLGVPLEPNTMSVKREFLHRQKTLSRGDNLIFIFAGKKEDVCEAANKLRRRLHQPTHQSKPLLEVRINQTLYYLYHHWQIAYLIRYLHRYLDFDKVEFDYTWEHYGYPVFTIDSTLYHEDLLTILDILIYFTDKDYETMRDHLESGTYQDLIFPDLFERCSDEPVVSFRFINCLGGYLSDDPEIEIGWCADELAKLKYSSIHGHARVGIACGSSEFLEVKVGSENQQLFVEEINFLMQVSMNDINNNAKHIVEIQKTFDEYRFLKVQEKEENKDVRPRLN